MQALTGSPLREWRLALGLRQADLAQAAGISASYLNLMEHNRRRIAPELLARLAARLGVEVAALAGAALADELRAAMADLPEQGAEVDRIENFAGRFPGWTGLLVALHRRSGGLLRAVEALNDRLRHDPHLSTALHDMLSAVSSVRSTEEILAETTNIEPDWCARFLQNLHQDRERLALRVEPLVAFLGGSDAKEIGAVVAPQEVVEGWLAARGWALAEIGPDPARLAQRFGVA